MKTNAERQRLYRQRHLHDMDGRAERINTLVNLSAKRSLERLSACYGVTQRAMLERMIAETEDKVLDQLPHGQHSKYYDGEPMRVAQ